MKTLPLFLFLFSVAFGQTQDSNAKLQATQIFQDNSTARVIGTFAGMPIKADSLQATSGIITYRDSLGNSYEQILLRRQRDGIYITQDERLLFVIPFANITEPRLQLIQGYLLLWHQLDAYLEAQGRLMNLQREIK